MEISRAEVQVVSSRLHLISRLRATSFSDAAHIPRCKNSCNGPDHRLNYQVTSDVFNCNLLYLLKIHPVDHRTASFDLVVSANSCTYVGCRRWR